MTLFPPGINVSRKILSFRKNVHTRYIFRNSSRRITSIVSCSFLSIRRISILVDGSDQNWKRQFTFHTSVQRITLPVIERPACWSDDASCANAFEARLAGERTAAAPTIDIPRRPRSGRQRPEWPADAPTSVDLENATRYVPSFIRYS